MSKTVIMSMWGDGEAVPREVYRQAIGDLRERLRHLPEHLLPVPADKWPPVTLTFRPVAVLQSRRFICQVYDEGKRAFRLSFNRSETELIGNVCQWKQGISWDDLQRLKREAGYGDAWAYEVFPADADVVNVANMRHLWVPGTAPSWGWRPEAVTSAAKEAAR